MNALHLGDIWAFSEGLAAVKQNDMWGFINREGRFAIQPRFHDVFGFSEGLAVVEIDKKYGYIDKNGNPVIAPKYDWAMPFSEGVASVMLGSSTIIIDKQGNKLFTMADENDEVNIFSDGLAVVDTDLKEGYINHEGKMVITPQFDYAAPFVDGIAVVNIGEKWGFINTEGEYILPLQFDQAESFSEGVAPVCQDGQWRFIDCHGETVATLGNQYTTVFSLSEGRAIVEKAGKYGAIDKVGNLIIDTRFDLLKNFSEGLAYARMGNTQGFITPTGTFDIQRPIPKRTLLDRLLGRTKFLEW